MTDRKHEHDREILERIARREMIDRGLLPDFSLDAQEELRLIREPANPPQEPLRDLRNLLWCSIDNDDSRDLDQLTVAEALPDGAVKILVAVADVDTLVKIKSAIDDHASHNTTSVYTPAKVFPMLPEKLSTDLTSLNYHEDRLAVIVEMVVLDNGTIKSSDIYRGWVKNRAKLAYNSVGAWLEGKGPAPDAIVAVEGLAENLKLQDRIAQELRKYRHECGALDLQTLEARPVFYEEELRDLKAEQRNRAREIIEDFMIAANSATAKFLVAKKYPSFRRIVRSPKRWDRIVELVSDYGFKLPPTPDPKPLSQFLVSQKTTDPLRFPDLSLSIIKLLGLGEYVVEFPGEENPGHFGLAVRDYTHSTAPNRRFADLVTQRILKAALLDAPMPYDSQEIKELALRCTQKEDDVNKVERLVTKAAAALLLQSRIGERFEGIVTGAADKGTWVRIFQPPVEGRLTEGFRGVDVGQRIRVQLIHTDVEKGFIDFRRVQPGDR
jgi:exoribonuclease-2